MWVHIQGDPQSVQLRNATTTTSAHWHNVPRFNLPIHANRDLTRCATVTSGKSLISRASRLTDDRLGNVSNRRPNLAVVTAALVDEACADDVRPDDDDDVTAPTLDDVRDADGGDCARPRACWV